MRWFSVSPDLNRIRNLAFILWTVFCAVYFLLNLLYVRDILSAPYVAEYKVHTVIAVLSHSVFITGILAVAYFAVTYRIRQRIIPLLLFSLMAVLCFSVTMGDIAVFRLFHFHYSGYILNEITQPGFQKTTGIGSHFWIVMAGRILGISLTLAAVGYFIARSSVRLPVFSTRRIVSVIIKTAAFVVVSEKIILLAVAYNRPAYIFKVADALPAVYINPADYSWVALNKFFKVNDSKETFAVISDKFSRCTYPVAQPAAHATFGRKRNVFLIVSESTRADFITQMNTPRIWDMAHDRNGTYFSREYSGSNSTHMSIFSILYSLNPWYSELIKTKRIESFPISLLRRNGYRAHMYMSASNQWHRMDLYMNQNFDDIFVPKTWNSDTRDREMTDDIVGKIRAGSGSPQFYFIFYDSTHYPFPFPWDRAVFTPFQETPYSITDYVTLDRIQTKLVNSYKNALHNVDSMIGQIYDALRQTGELEDSIIIYTGDHGCEFGETGRFFYSSVMNEYTTHVPLVIWAPSRGTVHTEISSHEDIFPTVLDLLGYRGDRSSMQGESVFAMKQDPYRIIAFQDALSPHQFEIVGEGRKLEVDLKRSSVVTGTYDMSDNDDRNTADTDNRIGYLGTQIHFLDRKPVISANNK